MTDIRTLPRRTQKHTSTGAASVCLELSGDCKSLQTLLVITDTADRTHVFAISEQEANRICDQLDRVTCASPQQRELWRLELEYAV